MQRVADVQDEFVRKYLAGDIAGSGTIEIIGASFVADKPAIFGTPNTDYITREIAWYLSGSLKVSDIPPPIPKIWDAVSSVNLEVNSNYGYLFFSKENHSQFDHVVESLRTKPDGRQATAIYTRPTMHADWNRDGMHDFVCTNAVNYFRRGDEVHAVVQMRSNDVVFGYRNDYAWQKVALQMVCSAVGNEVVPGDITWQAASLHVYPRHFHLIKEMAK